jgi:hypothetical protein
VIWRIDQGNGIQQDQIEMNDPAPYQAMAYQLQADSALGWGQPEANSSSSMK